MTAEASQAVGRRIKQAREDASYTQEELARDVGLDRSALSKVESGSRNVSALELAAIADVLGIRIEWFVDDSPPAVLSRRNMREPGAPSPAIDKLTERVTREVEFVTTHAGQIGGSLPESLPHPSSQRDVESCAAAARELLGLSQSEPVHDLAGRVSSLGLLAFSFDLGAEAADGSSMMTIGGGVALVNGHLQVGRRRLTLAHELGHYLFADEYSVDWEVAGTNQTDSREGKIDHFARALLLPPEGLTAAWTFHGESEHTLREAAVITASEFRVDMSTLSRRLQELGVVPSSAAHEIRGIRTTRSDIVEFDLLIHQEMESPYLPRAYVEAVLGLYRNETVSSARALELLFDSWSEEDLPPLQTLPEAAIWSFVS